MPKIAWAKNVYNAYNHIKKGDKVFDSEGNLLGVADGGYARCTAKSSGSVFLNNSSKSVSGDVEKTDDGWKLFVTAFIIT